jgi:hypothetical protein
MKDVVTEIVEENSVILINSSKQIAGLVLTTWNMALEKLLQVWLKGLGLGLAMCFVFVVGSIVVMKVVL